MRFSIRFLRYNFCHLALKFVYRPRERVYQGSKRAKHERVMPRGSGVARLLSTLFLAAFLALHAAELAPANEFEGKPIQSVRFEPPSQPVTRADLTRLMLPLNNGAPLHLSDVRSAIKQLYATGLYSNIEVETEPSGNGVAIVIRTAEQWFVGPVEVHGKVRYPPNEGQLANASRLELGTPF